MSEKNGERQDTDDKAPLGRLQTGTSGGVNRANAQPGQTGGGGSTTRPSSLGVRTGSLLSQVWGRKGGQFRGEGK